MALSDSDAKKERFGHKTEVARQAEIAAAVPAQPEDVAGTPPEDINEETVTVKRSNAAEAVRVRVAGYEVDLTEAESAEVPASVAPLLDSVASVEVSN